MDWKKTLATVAPGIATALGGPMAGMAIKMATDALGIEPNEDALIEAISTGNPEVLLQLKTVDANLKVELKKLDIQLDSIHQKDRAAARKMAEIVGLSPQIFLSVAFVAGYFGVLFFVFSGGLVPDSMHNMLHSLVGIMSAGMIQIMNFFFGSSVGSKIKTGFTGNG